VQQGLGALIQNASSFFQLDIIYVGISSRSRGLTLRSTGRAGSRLLLAARQRGAPVTFNVRRPIYGDAH
jgi:NitT/TauT family transport system permease protein